MTDDRSKDEKDPPLKNVIGSRGDGGWIGRWLKSRKEDRKQSR